MPLTRRAMLSLAFAGALWPLTAPAEAQRFVNRTGLRPGRFIWESAKAADGPLLIIVSLGERIAHVYRGGTVVGISTCFPATPGGRTPTGVFTILEKEKLPVATRSEGAGIASRERLTWSGVALHVRSLSGYSASYGMVRLPPDFSTLLYDVTHRGATVIIADEHTLAGEVIGPGTLFPPLAADEARPPNQADGDRMVDSLSEAAVTSAVVSILVSGAAAKAFVMRDGAVETETRVTISEPQRKLGTHVYSLLELDADGNPARWLAFGTGLHRDEAHLATWQADVPLKRIAFAQREWGLAAARMLHAGATLVITDDAAPPIPRATPRNFVILTNQTLEPRRKPAPRRRQPPRDDPNGRNERGDREDRRGRDDPTRLHPVSPR